MTGKPYKVHSVRGNSRHKWLWITLGSIAGVLLIMGGVALGYYLWLDAKVSASNDRVTQDVRDALKNDPTSTSLQVTSTTDNTPEATNILLLGSDTRSDTIDGSRSDTIILLHVDPANNFMSMLSLPRDLRVEVDGYGTRKLNYAFAKGGAALTIKTIQQITGVDIDHYLEVDFAAFTQMTDTLGGVYVEVDRPYSYNGGLYEDIELGPGYQLLDGVNALDYVRFRHDDNADFGRMERQQRFLNALRQQAMGWDLGLKVPGLVGSFFDNVTTDIGTNEFIDLALWGVRLDGGRIRQVALRGMNQISSGVTLVFWKQKDMDAAVQTLLTPPGAAPVVTDSSTATSAAPRTTTTEAAPSFPKDATPSTIPNAAMWKQVAKMASFPIEAPAYVPDGYRLAARSKTYAYMYDIKVGGETRPTVVMLYRSTGAGKAGAVKLKEEYLNVTATAWLDAPVASPGAEVRYNGVVFTIVGTADKVERVWWKKDGVLYWVSNTLARVVSGPELLAMAQSMIPIPAQ